MRRVLTTLGAATMLIGLPLAAAAHDDDRGWRGDERYGHYRQPKIKRYYAPPVAYWPGPPVIYRPAPPVAYYPAPRVVERPVYVPAPAPAPAPWPFNHVDVGFRIFF